MRRLVAIASTLALLGAIAMAAPVGARTSAGHFTAVGPGMQALWANGNVKTLLLVTHQLNGADSTSFVTDVLIVRQASNPDGSVAWAAMWEATDDSAPPPAFTFVKPLRSGSIEATASLLGCVEGTCPTLAPTVAVSDEWTGVGAIERMRTRDYWGREPGVMLITSNSASFFRDAQLADADPFGGGLGELGGLSMAQLFDVHIAQAFICQVAADCE